MNQNPHRRYDPLRQTWVIVSPQRNERPWQGQLESDPTAAVPIYDPDCYLCPGAVRALGVVNPRYDTTFVFDNDFPALVPSTPASAFDQGGLLAARAEPGVCRVVCYSPRHDLALSRMDCDALRRVVDVWAEEFESLARRPEINYVLVFENRGAEVGATIGHPHGQIYAFDFVPDVPARELRRGRPNGDPGQRIVATASGWKAWVPEAHTFPYELVLSPNADVPDLPSLDDPGRDGLARLLVDVLSRLDRVFDAPTPYMLWIHQRPFDSGEWPYAKIHVEIVSPWRAAGVQRYVAAGELGSGVFFNPVPPEDAARALREA